MRPPAAGAAQPPPPDRPDGTPAPGTTPPRQRPGHGRRVLILAGAVALVGLATYTWGLSATTASPGSGRTAVKGQPQPSVVAAGGRCVVSYAVWSDTGERFKASVTVANRDSRPVKDWELWWVMQGDQELSGNGKVRLDQQGTTVTVKAPRALDARRAVTLDVTGRYDRSNAAPMVFQLNSETCETYVSGKPGEPSRPVQRLPNGRIELGPPVTDTPVPGISVDPGGIVVPGPGTTTGEPDEPGGQQGPVASEPTGPPTGTPGGAPRPNPSVGIDPPEGEGEGEGETDPEPLHSNPPGREDEVDPDDQDPGIE